MTFTTEFCKNVELKKCQIKSVVFEYGHFKIQCYSIFVEIDHF